MSGQAARKWAVPAIRHIYKSQMQPTPVCTIALKGKLEGVWTARWPPGAVFSKTHLEASLLVSLGVSGSWSKGGPTTVQRKQYSKKGLLGAVGSYRTGGLAGTWGPTTTPQAWRAPGAGYLDAYCTWAT